VNLRLDREGFSDFPSGFRMKQLSFRFVSQNLT
jgi:hypothetical protein